MTASTGAAWAAFARDMGAALNRLADALAGPEAGSRARYGPVTAALPWHERVLRQCLILHEISEGGGRVAQVTWYEIARRYGYTGRGLAGFFRSNGQGLLELRPDGTVHVTARGRERLHQNRERVSAALAEDENDKDRAVT